MTRAHQPLLESGRPATVQSESRTALASLGARVVPTKLQVPHLPDGVVARPRLLARVGALGDRPLLAVIAPAGFGKSTLLAQVAMATSRPVAWYTADHRDSDPATLALGLAAAVDRVTPLAPEAVLAVTVPGSSVWTSAVPRLADAISEAGPVVIVIDEVDLIANREAVEVLISLIDNLAPGAQILVAGRTAGDLPIARLIVDRKAAMIEQEDLAFLVDEAYGLLSSAGATLPPADVAALVERTQGWAAAMYLAAVANARTGRSVDELLADRWVGDYVRSEVLTDLSPGIARSSPARPSCSRCRGRSATRSWSARAAPPSSNVSPGRTGSSPCSTTSGPGSTCTASCPTCSGRTGWSHRRATRGPATRHRVARGPRAT